jgi:hypothetical protein
MSYTKNTWVDQDVERPKTYEVTNNQDGSITLTDSFGLVTELGTPVNADNMNHIEDGIFNNSEELDTKVNKSGDTMTGALITQYSNTDEVGFYVSDTDITKGTAPSATEYMGVYFNDENENGTIAQARIGCIESAAYSDGSTELHLFTYQNVANSDTKAAFRLKMSAAGTGSCEFPQTNNCDGQWVNVNQVIASDVNFNTGATELKTYSLASYLPDDNYTYEVLFTLGGQTAATSGASFGFSFNSDIVSNVFVCRAIARSNAFVQAYGAAIVPLKTRQIKVGQVNITSGTPTMTTLRICGYRRVGTNA